jgi:hypothetical protein
MASLKADFAHARTTMPPDNLKLSCLKIPFQTLIFDLLFAILIYILGFWLKFIHETLILGISLVLVGCFSFCFWRDRKRFKYRFKYVYDNKQWKRRI